MAGSAVRVATAAAAVRVPRPVPAESPESAVPPAVPPSPLGVPAVVAVPVARVVMGAVVAAAELAVMAMEVPFTSRREPQVWFRSMTFSLAMYPLLAALAETAAKPLRAEMGPKAARGVRVATSTSVPATVARVAKVATAETVATAEERLALSLTCLVAMYHWRNPSSPVLRPSPTRAATEERVEQLAVPVKRVPLAPAALASARVS